MVTKPGIRERTINKLKKGKVDIVVATDVAARGLDVERISHVINFDIPYDNESYVHRIGRTGRAGREGTAILLLHPKKTRLLRSIEKSTRQSIPPLTMPSNEQLSDQRIEQFTQQLLTTMETPRLDKFRDMIVKFASDNELDMADIAAALTYENQKDRPLFPKLDNIVAPRPERQNKKADSKTKKERTLRDEDGKIIPMITYRLEVGKNDGVEPANIVGAIANEADISSQYIGQIKLYDSFSTVDLPEGMPNEIFNHLKKVRVRGNPLNISLLGDTQNTDTLSNAPEATSGRKRKPAKSNKKATSAKQINKKHRADRAPVKNKKTQAKRARSIKAKVSWFYLEKLIVCRLNGGNASSNWLP